MKEFQRLICTALVSGVAAGLIWFALQYRAVLPLIEQAERYENAAGHGEESAADHHAGEWRPAGGWERNTWTAVSTVLTSVAFAAILFGWTAACRRRVDRKNGLLWGLAAFACFSLAPALQFPPAPPGVAVANVVDRQVLWLLTVLATAAGLHLLIGRSRPFAIRLLGLVALVLPHAIQTPAVSGATVVPDALIRQFAIASLATTAAFWMVLGFLGGWIEQRYRA